VSFYTPHATAVFDSTLSHAVYPLPVGVAVSRLDTLPPIQAPCALCWVGPGGVAGLVLERSAPDARPRPICSRCLVTLEMLAAQFGPDLRLQIEPPA
jgi:hypothetical protein